MKQLTLQYPDDLAQAVQLTPDEQIEVIPFNAYLSGDRERYIAAPSVRAFEKKLDEVELMEKILEKSELTENNAERIGHRIKGSAMGTKEARAFRDRAC